MKRWTTLRSAVEKHGRVAMVTVSATEGSVPRNEGAWMIVTRGGFHGTIGGGALEWQALAQAQKLLQGETRRGVSTHVLGPDLGQCCGGRVQLTTELFDAASIAGLPHEQGDQARHVFLYGAGHVGKALVLALAPLPFAITWIDSREEAFPSVMPQNVTALQLDHPVEALNNSPAGALVYVMTHSHALDLEIVDAALRMSNIAHVGLIGSATKRARFIKRLTEAGVSSARISGLICPIGVPGIGSKEPAAIAAATVAQMLILDEALRQGRHSEQHVNLSA